MFHPSHLHFDMSQILSGFHPDRYRTLSDDFSSRVHPFDPPSRGSQDGAHPPTPPPASPGGAVPLTAENESETADSRSLAHQWLLEPGWGSRAIRGGGEGEIPPNPLAGLFRRRTSQEGPRLVEGSGFGEGSTHVEGSQGSARGGPSGGEGSEPRLPVEGSQGSGGRLARKGLGRGVEEAMGSGQGSVKGSVKGSGRSAKGSVKSGKGSVRSTEGSERGSEASGATGRDPIGRDAPRATGVRLAQVRGLWMHFRGLKVLHFCCGFCHLFKPDITSLSYYFLSVGGGD